MDTIEWTGPVGDAWASEWHRTDRSFSGLDPALNRHLLDHLPERADRIVDIGCGAGSTAIAIAQARPQTRVIGIDLSAALLDVARSRGNAVANLDFRHGSAERAVAELAPVDGYISRHGVMFFGDPVAAFTALRASAAPGAPLLFSCFRSIASNPWASELAAASSGGAAPVTDSTDPGPFAFADAEYVERILTAA
ncbi:MAG: class I SAM-dependent methyltransferase, partial [Sphingomonas sp.]